MTARREWTEAEARDAMTEALGDRPEWFDGVTYGVSLRVGRALLTLKAERDEARAALAPLRAEVRAWRTGDWQDWPTLGTERENAEERAAFQKSLEVLAAARAATDAAHALEDDK